MTTEIVADPGLGIGNPPIDPNPGLSGDTPPKAGDPVPKGDPAPKAGDPPPTPAPKGDPAPKAADPAPKPAPKAGDPPKPAPTAADPPPKEPTPPAPVDFPNDWRQRLAGDDKKLLARLERMTAPKDLLNSYLALEQRLSSGDFTKKLPTNFTSEELAEYRKTNGIPEKPDGYDTKIDGVVWGESDKPLLNSFTAAAHEANIPGDVVKWALNWYQQDQMRMVDHLQDGDNKNSTTATEALRAEWGGDYKPNLNAVGNLFAGAPEGMWDTIMMARDREGRRLGDNPNVLKWFATTSRGLNPWATSMPDEGGADPVKKDSERRAEIRGMMADKSGPYWRGPQSAALQEEYRAILDRADRASQMKGAA